MSIVSERAGCYKRSQAVEEPHPGDDEKLGSEQQGRVGCTSEEEKGPLSLKRRPL